MSRGLHLERRCWFRIKVSRAASSGDVYDVYIRLFEELLTLAMLVLCFKSPWWLPRRCASQSSRSVAGMVKQWRIWERPKWFKEINPTQLSVTWAPCSSRAFGASPFVILCRNMKNIGNLVASLRRWMGNLRSALNLSSSQQQYHRPGTQKIALQMESYSWNPGKFRVSEANYPTELLWLNSKRRGAQSEYVEL